MPCGKRDLLSCLSLSWRVLGGLSHAWQRDQTFFGCSCLELSLHPAHAFALGDSVERLNPLPGEAGSSSDAHSCRIDPGAVGALHPKHSGLELPQSIPGLEHSPGWDGPGEL